MAWLHWLLSVSLVLWAKTFRVSYVHELTRCCWRARLLEEGQSVCCLMMAMMSLNLMVQMVDLSTVQSSMEHPTFRYEPMTLRKFVDKTRRLQRHAGCQALLDRKNFDRVPVACKDDAMDEALVQLTVIRFYPMMDDMNFQVWTISWKVHLYSLYWPYQQVTISEAWWWNLSSCFQLMFELYSVVNRKDVAGEDGVGLLDGRVGVDAEAQGDHKYQENLVRYHSLTRSNHCGCPMDDPCPFSKADLRLHSIPFQNLLK